jgi:hypothetical protein
MMQRMRAIFMSIELITKVSKVSLVPYRSVRVRISEKMRMIKAVFISKRTKRRIKAVFISKRTKRRIKSVFISITFITKSVEVSYRSVHISQKED